MVINLSEYRRTEIRIRKKSNNEIMDEVRENVKIIDADIYSRPNILGKRKYEETITDVSTKDAVISHIGEKKYQELKDKGYIEELEDFTWTDKKHVKLK